MTDHELEQRMWEMLKDAANNQPSRQVRLAKLADNHLPIPHKEWTVDVIKHWDSRGLVIALEGGAHAILTEKGVRTDDITEER